MFHDLRLLLWLRIRHARTNTLRLIHAVGADPTVDCDWDDRLYQVYIAAIFAVFFVLMWSYFLDMVVGLFAVVGAEGSAMVLAGALLMSVSIFVLIGVSGLRSSLLKFSHPDIAFVASSSLSSRALVGSSAGCVMVMGGVVAALGGYLVGVGLATGLGTFASPFVVALVLALLIAAAIGGAWVIGIARLVLVRRKKRWRVLAVLALVLVTVAAFCSTFIMFMVPVLLENSTALGPVCLALCGVIFAEAVVLRILAPHIDMTLVIEENALFADLQPFGPLSPLDPNTIEDYRRRRKVARCLPWFHLPSGKGPAALVSRTALSLVRQYEGFSNLFLLGVVVTPLGICALFGVGGVMTLMIWLAALVLVSRGPRELTRAFRDDIRIRLVRDQLPYRTLSLLLLDSLPAYIIVTLLSWMTVLFVAPPAVPVAPALILGAIVNGGVVLSCGLDAVRLSLHGPSPWGEAGLMALVFATALASFQPSVWILVGVAIVVDVVIAAMIYGGVERAR